MLEYYLYVLHNTSTIFPLIMEPFMERLPCSTSIGLSNYSTLVDLLYYTGVYYSIPYILNYFYSSYLLVYHIG
ncbi:hypothetical protein L873DRAFT_968819 [Choiromyces venosus 120613-1]|uniref:Uncharacterized protein n=1 Tax=Choiromyces venosus 120613-1 TaxID=1336337 RepID=A0A3N4K426_9PEZI|nr:hypothetical protein L873DRAFT_968819 [Choiromyces venosus 120613-1]